MINRNFSQIIITFAFLYSSLICHFEAMDKFNEKDIVMSILLWICSFSSLMGAFRFKIAKLVTFFRNNRNE